MQWPPKQRLKVIYGTFLVDKNPPASVGDKGLIPVREDSTHPGATQPVQHSRGGPRLSLRSREKPTPRAAPARRN